jgi:6-pyruvoyl-tetrahydropterin synthase
MKTTYTPKLGQLLKMAPNFKKYIWQKLKTEKPNITNKMISKHSVATMVETHFEVDIATIEVDNQIVVIQVQVQKNIVEDVLINGGVNVNIIIENFRTKLGLPKLRPSPYHLRMAD